MKVPLVAPRCGMGDAGLAAMNTPSRDCRELWGSEGADTHALLVARSNPFVGALRALDFCTPGLRVIGTAADYGGSLDYVQKGNLVTKGTDPL